MTSMLRPIVSALVASGAVLAAQAPPQFRSGVDLVHLDVSVLDKNRRPVQGLTAKDFTIFEDGKPQTVATFSAIDLPDPAPPPTRWMREVSSDVRRNTDIVDKRLVSIVMDDAAIPFDIAMVRSAREIGRLVVDRLGPNDLASIVFTRDNRNAQEFTGDRARLLKAVESFEAGSRVLGVAKDEAQSLGPIMLSQIQSFETTVDVLRRVADSLTAVPQRRKALIYIGVGVPAGNTPSEIVLAGASSLENPTAAANREMQAALGSMKHRLMAVYRDARLSNVNVYTVSPAGVGGMAALLQSEVWKGRILPAYETYGNYTDFLVGLAENTGGRAFPDRNEFATAIDQVFVENGSYYLLGYPPPAPFIDGKYRRVEIKVNRPDVIVRTRNGYYNDKPADARKVENASLLTTALAGLLPKTEIELEATAAPFAMPGRPDAGVVVVLTIHQDTGDRDVRTREKVDVQVAAFSNEGAPRGNMQYGTEVTLRPGPAGPVEYEVLTGLSLKPGRYQLRLSALVGAQNKTGSVYYDLEVPDFQARPLSLSGLLLTSDPKPVSTDTDRIKAYVPVAPTARRTFSAADRVTAFARLYQGGQTSAAVPDPDPSRRRQSGPVLQTVQLSILVTDSQGTVRFRRAEAVASDMFGSNDRMAEFRMDVPLKDLTPGEYLLTLDATSSRGAARRDVRFTIR
jgi:VWFA-related protein